MEAKLTTKKTGLTLFNYTVTLFMILLTLKGSIDNGWFTLANLVSWLGLVGTIGLAHAKSWNFPFNMAQNVFAAVQGGKSKLFGDMLMSLFYFGSQIYGMKNWKRNTVAGKVRIEKQSNWTVIIISIVVGFFVLGGISWVLGGAYIVLDALNNSTAIVAQVMQMRRQRASWILWGATNAIGIVIWMGVGEPQMAIMFTAFLLNSLRGWVNWNDTAEA